MKRQLPRSSTTYQAGFTLVELVAILIIIGILAAVAIPRFFDRKTFDARAFFDQTQSMVRYAHKVAIAQNRNVHIRLNGASVALCFDTACAAPVAPPSGMNSGSAATLAACGNIRTWFCEATPPDIAYTAAASSISYVSANPMFFFSALGKPFNTGDAIPASTFTQPLTISVSGDGTTRNFIVEHETGYVHD